MRMRACAMYLKYVRTHRDSAQLAALADFGSEVHHRHKCPTLHYSAALTQRSPNYAILSIPIAYNARSFFDCADGFFVVVVVEHMPVFF